MQCESCKTRPATRILTQIVNGEKRLLYRCDACAAAPQGKAVPPTLERPCDRCKKREGRIKLTRLGERSRTISYLCEVCAGVAKQ